MDLSGTVADIRRAFDASFAAPVAETTAELVELLVIKIAGETHLIRLGEITGLVPAGKIVALPSRSPAVLGVIGVRGNLVPVLSLASLLGYGSIRETTGWLVLCGPPGDTLALAVARLDGTLAIPPSAICAAEQAANAHATEIARTGSGTHAVISVPSLLTAQKARRSLLEIDGMLEEAEADKRWPEILNHDSTLTSALLDRVLHHAETVVIEGKSYRMKDQIDPEPAA